MCDKSIYRIRTFRVVTDVWHSCSMACVKIKVCDENVHTVNREYFDVKIFLDSMA